GIPTIFEYSQLTTPQSVYVMHMLLKIDVAGILNGFVVLPRQSWEVFQDILRMLGGRYYVSEEPSAAAKKAGYPVVVLPRRPHTSDRPSGSWYVYELPEPNLGNYSPTRIVVAQSAADIIEAMSGAGFDFSSEAVVSVFIAHSLVPARDVRLSLIRGGLHVTGQSDGTSLILLPQQFSHCLRALDRDVRLVRTNLMLTGAIFSDQVDTDIVFDYDVFFPGCRRKDLADMKRLDVSITARMPHLSGPLFPEWKGLVERVR